MVWSEGAPGSSEWRCKVCELRTEIGLLRDSRQQIAKHATDLEGIIACALADHDGWKQEAMDALLNGPKDAR